VPAFEGRLENFGYLISGNMETIKNASIGRRLSANIAGIYTWLERPILGVGINNLGSYAPSKLPSWAFYRELETAHNGYIQVLSELGAIGFIVYMSVWFGSMFRIKNSSKHFTYSSFHNIKALVVISLFLNLATGFPYTDPMSWFLLSIFATKV
jgi:O-antigen ligase